jgi:hypothetical protein
LHADQFILAGSKGKNETFVIRLDINRKTFLRVSILDFERSDSWPIDSATFPGEHSHHPPDSDIRLDDALLRYRGDFIDASLEEKQPRHTRPA